MSGVINKIKDALHGDKHHDSNGMLSQFLHQPLLSATLLTVVFPSAAPLAKEHGTQSGVHDTDTSVAHGSSISPTNPGMLHSTEYGIHGERDPGTGTSAATSGDDSRLTDTTRDTLSGRTVEGHSSSANTTTPGTSLRPSRDIIEA